MSRREPRPKPEPTLPVEAEAVEAEVSVPAPLPPERGVEPVDAITAYMAQLRHHPPISREEEHALAVRWAEEGDLDAARQLVLANMRLVVKIAMEYRRAWTNFLDLIQEGNVGLMQAVQRFDPYRDVKLSSYAVYWIRAYLLKYILDNLRMVRMGTTRVERKLFFRLNKEKRELEKQGFAAEPRLLAERLDVSEDDVRDMEQRLAQGDLSLDAPVARDGSTALLGDFVESPGQSVEEQVSDREFRQVFLSKVKEFAASLDERQRRIVERRILAEEPATLQEIGEEFGVTRERVRQIEARLVTDLREYLGENLVDFEYYAPARD